MEKPQPKKKAAGGLSSKKIGVGYTPRSKEEQKQIREAMIADGEKFLKSTTSVKPRRGL